MVENFCFKFDDPNYGGLSEIVRINRQTDRQTDRQQTPVKTLNLQMPSAQVKIPAITVKILSNKLNFTTYFC